VFIDACYIFKVHWHSTFAYKDIKSAAAIELEADKNLSQPKAIACAKNAQ
jgi:hypothetical protein